MLIIRCREPSLHLSDYMPVQEKTEASKSKNNPGRRTSRDYKNTQKIKNIPYLISILLCYFLTLLNRNSHLVYKVIINSAETGVYYIKSRL